MNPVSGRRLQAALCLALAFAGHPAVLRGEDARLLPAIVGTSELYASDIRSGLALSGYDPLSYRLGPAPTPGLTEHEVLHGGLAWRFVSAANRAAFLRDPEAFLPRIGGYDAEAAAFGRVVQPRPDIFALRNGRLYLFRSEAARARFLADDDVASGAEANWPRLRTGLVRG